MKSTNSTSPITLVFDMDGVITTEEKYWACARLTLWEVVTKALGLTGAFGDAPNSEEVRQQVTSDELIYALKGLAVNSNWDIAYVLTCVYLTALSTIGWVTLPNTATPEDFLSEICKTLGGAKDAKVNWPIALVNFLDTTNGMKGRELIAEAGLQLKAAAHIDNDMLLEVDGPFWWYLHSRFQRFYHGEAMRENNAPTLPDGTVIPADHIESALQALTHVGYTIGTATGRPLDELNDALGGLGLLNYFDPTRFGTLDVVREAESTLNLSGLAKPHPLSLLHAVYPDLSLSALFDPALQETLHPNVIMIGDSTSDILMARSVGARSVGVLTGVRGEIAQREREQLLRDAGCDAILPDITYLPEWLAANA